MNPSIQLSIIIVNYNVADFISLCLDSVSLAIKNISTEVIVVDNDSHDNSVEVIKKHFPFVQLIESDTNLGFSKANNLAYSKAKGKYIHFLNPDTVIPEDYYDTLIPFMENTPNVGAVGPRIVDGKGSFAPDSKKSFPSFWVSVSKVLGLSQVFSNSSFFNKYYAAHIDEYETAEVDILSGSTLLIKKEVIDDVNGAFDESYFMYCEDVDLCYRIQQAGYQNYYVPKVSMIHYKGESTKKLSYSYMKVFYTAHALFVKKYYPKNLGALYNFALKMVLGLRHLFNFGKMIFSLIKLFVLDSVLLSLTFLLTIYFWFDSIVQLAPLSTSDVLPLLPIFVSLWLISLYLNGAYDKPHSLYKAGRGMVVGGVLVLAAYSLLPYNFRFSRGAVLLSAVFGTLIILITRWLLSKMRWIKLVPRGKLDYSLAVVCNESAYQTTSKAIQKKGFQSHLIGFISTDSKDINCSKYLGPRESLGDIVHLFHLDEIIFDTSSQSYKDIINEMGKQSGKQYFNIYLPNQNLFIGSYYDTYLLEYYQLHQKYPIGKKEYRRNKRILDFFLASFLLTISPFIFWGFQNKSQLFKNFFGVLVGKYTWVGYPPSSTHEHALPVLKHAILMPYKMTADNNMTLINKSLLYKLYAETYTPLDDFKYWWMNRKYLDAKPIY